MAIGLSCNEWVTLLLGAGTTRLQQWVICWKKSLPWNMIASASWHEGHYNLPGWGIHHGAVPLLEEPTEQYRHLILLSMGFCKQVTFMRSFSLDIHFFLLLRCLVLLMGAPLKEPSAISGSININLSSFFRPGFRNMFSHPKRVAEWCLHVNVLPRLNISNLKITRN